MTAYIHCGYMHVCYLTDRQLYKLYNLTKDPGQVCEQWVVILVGANHN